MRKLFTKMLSLSMAAALLFVPGSASGKSSTRTVDVEYTVPVIGTTAQPPTSACVTTDQDCPLSEKALKGERFLTVSISDESGMPASATVEQGGMLVKICGSTETPIKIAPSRRVKVYVYALGDPDCPSAATGGTVHMSFSNRP
jgi:hypothetical protein